MSALGDRLKNVLGGAWHVTGDAFCDQIAAEMVAPPDFGVANMVVTGTETVKNLTQGAGGGTLGFFGATPVAGPVASTGQSALSTGVLTGLAVTTTGIVTTGIVAGLQTTGQVAALISSVNALMTAVSDVTHLANNLRAALVQTSGVGLIKGSI